MADRINFRVSATPIETLTTENSTDKDVIASEVNTILSGGGDSINLANYSGLAVSQGYLNGVVNYFDAVHTAGGARLSTTNADFWYIKNTGYKFSSATVLGSTTTDCVAVAIKIGAWSSTVSSGYADGQTEVGEVKYIEIAWLKPGQSIVLPSGGAVLADYNFGGAVRDWNPINAQTVANEGETINLHVKTIQSNGSAATDGNAVEFLSVS